MQEVYDSCMFRIGSALDPSVSRRQPGA